MRHSDLSAARELAQDLQEVVARMTAIQGRDRGSLECLVVEVGHRPVFGNDDVRCCDHALHFGSDYNATADAIVGLFESYLTREKLRIESALCELGVDTSEEGK